MSPQSVDRGFNPCERYGLLLQLEEEAKRRGDPMPERVQLRAKVNDAWEQCRSYERKEFLRRGE